MPPAPDEPAPPTTLLHAPAEPPLIIAPLPPPARLLERMPPAPPPPPARGRELLAWLALIGLADLGIYQGGGAGLATMIGGAPIALWLAAQSRTRSARRTAITALLALVALRCLWHVDATTGAIGGALVVSFAIALHGQRAFVPELVASALATLAQATRHARVFFASAWRALPRRRGAAAIVIPLALVALFGAIFAAANPVIGAWVSAATSFLVGDWAPEPVRWLCWATYAVAAAALLRPVLRSIARLDARLGIAHDAAPDARAPSPGHLALARNGMLALNALFLGYNALDAVYLWAGRVPDSVSFTKYAHEGVAWLSLAFVLSTVVIGAMFRGPIAQHIDGARARKLAYVWAAQNLVLALGTFRRIQMYIVDSGLTELRIVGIVGTTLTIAGLAIVVIKLARRRTMLWMMRRQLDAFAIAVVAYTAAPTAAIATHYNVACIAEGRYEPLLHFFRQALPPEALPSMIPLLAHPNAVVREGVAVLLVENRDELRAKRAASSWLDVDLSRARALAAIDDVALELADVLPIFQGAARGRLYSLAEGANYGPIEAMPAEAAKLEQESEFVRRGRN